MGTALRFPILIAISAVFALAMPAFAAEQQYDYYDTTALPQGVSIIQAPPNATTVDVQGLPPGCHIASAQEAASAPNLIAGQSLVCPADEILGINPDVGAAKEYLYTLTKDLRNSCAPPTRKSNITNLDNGFAMCAAEFFREYQKQYGAINIVSAFRDGRPGTAIDGSGRSANQCAGGAGGSNHTRGVAMDINPAAGSRATYQTLWAFGEANPGFGICFPHQDGRTLTRYKDFPHMILAGVGGKESAACAQRGVRAACQAGARFYVKTPLGGGDAYDMTGNDSGYYSPGGSAFTPGGGSFGGGGATGSFLPQLMQAVQPLANLLRQQQLQSQFQQSTTPTTPPMTSTPLAPEIGKVVGDAFKPPTPSTYPTPPPTFPPASFPPSSSPSTTQKTLPEFFEEQLGQISVTAPHTTEPPLSPTPATQQITAEEFLYLQEQQNIVEEPDVPTTVVMRYEPQQPSPTTPFAGFVPPRLEEEPSQAFLQVYVDALRKVSLALSQAYHFLTAPPQY